MRGPADVHGGLGARVHEAWRRVPSPITLTLTLTRCTRLGGGSTATQPAQGRRPLHRAAPQVSYP
eukprot:scaffold71498_cov36-Phaeocystis_antarctica.AAC.1